MISPNYKGVTMEKEILTKADLAARYGISEKSINTACSRNPSSLPPFFKLGVSKNSQIRFRLEDCLAFEAEMKEKQQQEIEGSKEQLDLQKLLKI